MRPRGRPASRRRVEANCAPVWNSDNSARNSDNSARNLSNTDNCGPNLGVTSARDSYDGIENGFDCDMNFVENGEKFPAEHSTLEHGDSALEWSSGEEERSEVSEGGNVEGTRCDGDGDVASLLQHGEEYVSAILANSLCGKNSSSSSKKRGRPDSDGENLDDMDPTDMKQPARVVRLTQQPSIITGGTLKPYQMEGLNWLVSLHENKLNGILADEMGLGKTFQTIALLAYLREYKNIHGPHLILAPKSTLGNWQNEIARFCPCLKSAKLLGTKEERSEILKQIILPQKVDVIITSYEMCIIEKSSLLKLKFKYLVIDEAHRIKNEVSKLSQVIRQYRTQRRLLLTGTPLQNNLKELWALMNFLFPEIFSSSDEFETLFDLTRNVAGCAQEVVESRNMETIRRLHKILKPFLLRRVKREVLTEMPPKKELLLFVPLSEMQKRLYKDVLTKNISALQGGDSSGRTQLLNLAMQLRKASNHPYLFDGYEDKSLDPFGEHVIFNAGKMVLLDKLLQRLHQRGSRTLIFSQMTKMIDILEDFCRIRAHKYFRIDGNTSGDERDRQIDEFNQPGSEISVFLLSTRAGGLGINLATADTVVLFDSDWNPQVDLQAMDRAHRIGQKKPVHVYRLVHEHTIEEKVIERATTKLQLDSAVIQHGRLADKQKQFSKNELLNMVQYGAQKIFKSGGCVTDADLDAILDAGEQRSAAMSAKIQEHVKKSLMDFSTASNSSNLYEFEGVDYNDEQRRADRSAWAQIAVSSMETRDEREARRRGRILKEKNNLAQKGRINATHFGPRITKLPLMQEWHFYQKRKIYELHEKEMEYCRSMGETEGPSEDDRLLKHRLISEGFGDWLRKDFIAFVRGSELYGRDDIARITTEVEGKTQERVRAYALQFWTRYHELTDHEKWIKRIQAGESLIRKRKDLQQVIVRKQSLYKHPWRELAINYAGHKGKTVFNEDEDRWLLNMTAILGYGNWEKMKSYIGRDPVCQFDWMMRSRVPAELGRRADTMIRLLKKEEEQRNKSGRKAVEDETPKSSQ